MFLRLFLVACLAGYTYARSPEEIKKWFMQMGMECNNEHPITQDEMALLQAHKIPESKNIKCLMACVFKKAEWLSETGTFDIDKAEAMLDAEFGDDADRKTNGKKLLDACRSVNDQTVGDGAAGCERSHLLTQCLIDHAPKFGFDLKHIHL